MRRALLAIVLVLAGCFTDDDDDVASPSPSPSPSASPTPLLLKADGTPANFACNGSFADPPSTASMITTSFDARALTTTGTPPSPNTTIVLYDAAAGTTNGAYTAVTDSAGVAAIAGLQDLTRYSFKLSRPAGTQTYVDTYTIGVLSPAVADAGTPVTVQIVAQTVHLVFLGLLSVTQQQIAGDAVVIGVVEDCDGDPVQNAFVDATDRCGQQGHGFPCVGYFPAGTPDKTALWTGTSGQFTVLGATAIAPYTVTVMGVTTPGAAPVAIGELTFRNVPDTISLVRTHPL